MFCKSCNVGYPEDAKYCAKCGEALIDNRDDCPSCESKIPEKSEYCIYCGKSVKNITKCANCGNVYPDSAQFCTLCGARADGKLKCAACDKLYESDMIFCAGCGKELQKPKNIKAKQVAVETKVVAVRAKNDASVSTGSVSKLFRMIKAWALVGMFALIFGLSFLPFQKIEVEGTAVAVTPIHLIGILGYNKTAAETERDFIKFASKHRNDDAEKVIQMFNPLKFSYTKENLESSPYSIYTEYFMMLIFSWGMLITAFTFFIITLVKAIKLTRGIAVAKSTGAFPFGILAGASVAAAGFCAGYVGGAVLATCILSFLALIGLWLYAFFLEKKKITDKKKFVSRLVSVGLSIAMLAMFGGSVMNVKYESENSGTFRAGYSAMEFSVGVDLNKYSDEELNELGYSTLQSSINIFEDYIAYSDGVMDDFVFETIFNPSGYAYIIDDVDGVRGVTVAISVLSWITLLAGVTVIAVLLAILLISVTEFRERRSMAFHIAAVGTSLMMFVCALIMTITAGSVLSLSPLFTASIGAIPIILLIFSIGATIQNIVLDRKTKTVAAA